MRAPTHTRTTFHELAIAFQPLRNTRNTFGVLLVALVLSGCNEHKDSAATTAATEVDFATVTLSPVRQWDEFNGRISAVDSVEVRPRVTGYVQKIVFKEGDEVRKGDSLFQIDPRKYQAALSSALARLERAKASVVMNEAQDQRAKVLVQNNAISKEEADTRRANFNQSQADVQDAIAAVALAKLDLEFTEVRSPINGRVSRAALTPGNLAVADQTLLTSVVSQNPVYVYFDPDEHSYLRYGEQARSAKGNAAQLGVRVGLANEQGFPHTGNVDFQDNQVDPATGTIRLRATLSNKNRMFTPGLFARVQLASSVETSTILIDDKAVLTDQDRKYVYVVGAGDTAERKDIQLGRMHDGLRIVESGLSPGDKVVVGGIQRIFYPGMALKPSEVAMTTTQN
ncbi:efflux RND transporter periplasmic adaptor subunit [Pseudomonas sp. TH49]|uniref:efflux RND transporter periplasmic adaptor subunit n=1 Tax=Pseudomonas sp. TH49 TaxID=2796413 RepID=UPI0019149F50|nr:efflux RND transporter periplasmic adaptor subunit [Pseudomonas sp. TH49]MBK5344686.1 efflux RND transporter periplasmic adaptor subunit [Pseudomonas sp. TH49]